MENVYDVIVLGAGPAGLTAGIYAGRNRMKTLIIERGQDGGQIAITSEIENYPGQVIDEEESGSSLVARMAKQAEQFGCERMSDSIQAVELEGDVKKLVGKKGEYFARSVILATGARSRPIGCEHEGAFVGRGISYCATCDANFFRGLDVYVVGGGDSAVEEALYLTNFARKVTIIHRRDELRAAKSIQKKAFDNPKVDFIWDSVVEEVGGDEGILAKMQVRNVKTDEVSVIEADKADGLFGLFGFVGHLPNTELFEGVVDMEGGYVLTDDDMHTNIPGVFAAGDLRKKSLRQVVTAAADGAIAAMQAYKYLDE